MSWDDDDYTPNLPAVAAAAPLPTKANWDDEEDQTVAELKSGPVVAAAAAPAQPQKIKEKHIEKAKQREREGKGSSGGDGAPTLCANCQADLAPLADPAAEKKRLEALAIKADIAAAQALMGSTGISGAGGAGGKAVLPTDTPTLVAAISLLSGDAFRDLGKHVATRVHEASGKGNVLAVRFYNELLQTGGEKLKVDELAALGKVIDAIRNKKLQEEKSKNKPGAGKAKAAKVRMGADLDSYDDNYDYGDVVTGSGAAAAAPAAVGTTVGTGNSGNVDMSLAAAGLAAAAGGDDKFVRQRFTAEDDFM